MQNELCSMLTRFSNRPSLWRRSRLFARWPWSCGVGILVACILLVCGGSSGAEKKQPAVPAKPATAKASSAAPNTKPNGYVDRAEWRPRYNNGRSYVSLQAVASYYGFNKLDLDGKEISMSLSDPPIRFDATIGSKRIRLNGMVFYFSFPVLSFSGQPAMLSSFDVNNVLDPILRPKARRDPSVLKVVVLDPAGGGVEKGVVTPYGEEKAITLDVARHMRPLLEGWGFTVIMTRDGDEAVFPLERVRMANLIHEEAIYISLQVARGGPTAKGIETTTIPPANTPATNALEKSEIDKRFYPGNINERESMALATTLQSSLIIGTKATDMGITRIPSEEMRTVEMPAVVCRLGYLTHKEEGLKLASDEYRRTLGESLARGVKKYADFLSKDLEKRRAEDAQRPLVFGRLQVTHLDAAAGVQGERVIIRVPVTAAKNAQIDRTKLEVQIFVYERINNVDLDLTVSNTPKIEWLSVLPDWKDTTTETFQAIYERPRLTAAETEKYGRRSYYGFVARLIYDGKLLDESSDPTNLNRSLYYFTPVFPKR